MTAQTPEEIAALVVAVRARERQVYTTKDVMQMLGINSPSTISDWIKFGKLPRRDCGRNWKRETIDQYLKAGK